MSDTKKSIHITEAAGLLGISVASLRGILYRSETVKSYVRPLHSWVDKSYDKKGRKMLFLEDVLEYRRKWYPWHEEERKIRKATSGAAKSLGVKEVMEVTGLDYGQILKALDSNQLESFKEDDILKFMEGRSNTPPKQDQENVFKVTAYVPLADVPFQAINQLMKISRPTHRLSRKDCERVQVLYELWDGKKEDNPFAEILQWLDKGCTIEVDQH